MAKKIQEMDVRAVGKLGRGDPLTGAFLSSSIREKGATVNEKECPDHFTVVLTNADVNVLTRHTKRKPR